ncbi:hypothetical protein COF68_06205 [Bacillus toyonensis]|uniref:hypothetical protein n=1 Tax=Bacillus toyonensis TaxID=155322 RepID=UPI000BFE84AC|nr:hypothetical protein [Bacillus toyonensis]PHE64426.1 hypothetical protein COF68_06205 [Bacillus toyonensis]
MSIILEYILQAGVVATQTFLVYSIWKLEVSGKYINLRVQSIIPIILLIVAYITLMIQGDKHGFSIGTTGSLGFGLAINQFILMYYINVYAKKYYLKKYDTLPKTISFMTTFSRRFVLFLVTLIFVIFIINIFAFLFGFEI